MKGLKKLTLATAIAAVPFAANADLKALDDSAMGNVTGQSGVTIELSAKVDVAEVAYQDEGFLAITDLSIGGAFADDGTQGNLDDLTIFIDVVGQGGIADTAKGAIGNAYLEGAAALKSNVTWTNTADADTAVVGSAATYESGMPTIEDGDLVIGIRSTSGVPVDFGVGIGSVALEDSQGTIGNLSATSGTTLISDLKMSGMFGPIDIVIQENQNKMNVNAYFNASGSLNVDFVGTYLDFELHNRRGADTNNLNITTTSGTIDESFANAQVDIGKTSYIPDYTNPTVTKEALAFNVNNFSGDLDLTNIRMGSADAASIGDLYLTDLVVNAQMTVYGHE